MDDDIRKKFESDLKKDFDGMDRNHNGSIDRDEFEFDRLDTDHSGEIVREEYAKVPRALSHTDSA